MKSEIEKLSPLFVNLTQLGWGNSVLCHCYYQGLPNQIQDPISTQEQGKPTLFQDIYALVMTIDRHY